MKASALEHRRTHNLLLISKLLGQRESASPFTLVIDTIEQSARPLLAEYLSRAKKASGHTIFVSFETLRQPPNVDVFIPCWKEDARSISESLSTCLKDTGNNQTTLIIIDCLNALCSDSSMSIPALLSSFIRPNVSLISCYHQDVPVSVSSSSAYQPTQLNMLKFLATTIVTTHSLHHVLSDAAASRDRKAATHFGLHRGISGVIIGEGAQDKDGIVLELEFRRKSGRGVREWYFMPVANAGVDAAKTTAINAPKGPYKETVILLEDQPQYCDIVQQSMSQETDNDHDVTFSTGLTERQRQDREGIVLPYFDAQTGGGDGGRILYDMTAEDDFDDEEDEI